MLKIHFCPTKFGLMSSGYCGMVLLLAVFEGKQADLIGKSVYSL